MPKYRIDYESEEYKGRFTCEAESIKEALALSMTHYISSLWWKNVQELRGDRWHGWRFPETENFGKDPCDFIVSAKPGDIVDEVMIWLGVPGKQLTRLNLLDAIESANSMGYHEGRAIEYLWKGEYEDALSMLERFKVLEQSATFMYPTEISEGVDKAIALLRATIGNEHE
jgi:hypothetical protein